MTAVKHKHTQHHDYDLSEDVEKIKAALMDATQNLKGRAGDFLHDSVDNIKDQAASTKSSIENYAAEKPFKSLGLTLFIGMAIGYFMKK